MDLPLHSPTDNMESRLNNWEWTGYGQTDQGLVRTSNQDAFLVDNRRRLWAVADGMGGHPGGDVASRIVMDTLADFAHTLSRGPTSDTAHDDEQKTFLLTTMAEQAHTTIRAHAERNPSLSGMGTTLVMAHLLPLNPPRLLILNVGDSRAYLIRGKTIIQLTRDHTLVDHLVREGRLSPSQAARHPERHMLTHAIGLGSALNSDVFARDLQHGDLLLLCSDGLTTMLTDEDILQTVLRHPHDPHESAQALIQEALGWGGLDNVTVVACAVKEAMGQANTH